MDNIHINDIFYHLALKLHGTPTTIQRNGMTTSSSYGLIDNLTATYNGYQIIAVNDVAANIPYAFSHDFKNYTSQPAEYTYNQFVTQPTLSSPYTLPGQSFLQYMPFSSTSLMSFCLLFSYFAIFSFATFQSIATAAFFM